MDRWIFLCFPPFQLNSQMPQENRGGASRRGFGGTSFDHTDMVPTSIAAVNPSSQTYGVDCRNGACHSSVSPQSSLHKGEAKIDSMSFIRRQYEEWGFSEHVTNVLLDSWRPSSQKQYAVYLKKWAVFCRERQITAYSPTLIDMLEFAHIAPFILFCFEHCQVCVILCDFNWQCPGGTASISLSFCSRYLWKKTTIQKVLCHLGCTPSA